MVACSLTNIDHCEAFQARKQYSKLLYTDFSSLLWGEDKYDGYYFLCRGEDHSYDEIIDRARLIVEESSCLTSVASKTAIACTDREMRQVYRLICAYH